MKKSPKRTQRKFLHLREVLPEFSKDTLPETLGSWCVEASERGICRIFWHQSNIDLNTEPYIYPHILAIVDEARRQITEYLRGRCRTFDIPVEYSGSEFQQQVWARLSKIPYGQTCVLIKNWQLKLVCRKRTVQLQTHVVKIRFI